MKAALAFIVSLLVSLGLAGCVTHATVDCTYTVDGWECVGGGGGVPHR